MPPVEGSCGGNPKLLGDFMNGIAVKHQLNVAFPHMQRLVRLVDYRVGIQPESPATALTLEPLDTAGFANLDEFLVLAMRAIRLVRGVFEQGLAKVVMAIRKQSNFQFCFLFRG